MRNQLVMLVVGNLQRWELKGIEPPQLEGTRFITFDALDGPLLAGLCPDLVVSPLLAEGFDALDLARRLAELGYRGRYRAVALSLPDPGLVQDEVRAVAPDLDFDVYLLED
ncbi:hypothetical protein [Pseudoroseicyclus sp. CXY001]|uniref:hypothetical protein n=1 Tax=Pseudoroseicyclus sp. CXY001 TaxID=3242492 RepID=UPI00358DBBB8